MRKKIIGTTLIISLSIFNIGCNPEHTGQIIPEQTKDKKISVLIPMYSYPTLWTEESEKIDSLQDNSEDFIAIANPYNGPDRAENQDYANGIENLSNKNIKMVGYIYTGYGSRSKTDVYNDIDKWADFYQDNGLKGIFLDEVSLNNEANLSIYKDYNEYIKSKGFELTIVNPGTHVDQSILDNKDFNIIVTYENPYEDWINYKNDLISNDITKQGLLVYNVDPVNFSNEIENAKNQGFDYMYFTSDNTPNPWDTIEDFFNPTLIETTLKMFYFLGKNTNDINEYPKISVDYNIITIDMEDSTTEEIQALKDKGIQVMCYISAGSWEDWRSDAADFPEEIKGNDLANWTGEKWLDISNQQTIDLIKLRIDRTKEKGCDGIDFDNVDGYTNDTGFELTYEDQLNYNKELASYAKSLNLKTILKNDLNQLDDLINDFDYAVNESCNKYDECQLYRNWVDNEKQIFNIEYELPSDLYQQNDYFKSYYSNESLDGSVYEEL